MNIDKTISSDHKWFYNLDGLRFLAAVLVILGHIEIIKRDFNLPSLYHYNFFTNAGPLAVTFFFVLSGFLISYLLMQEQQKKELVNKRIDLLGFYRKRILRIWPLYYVLVLLTFLVFPHIIFFQYPGYQNNFLSTNSDALLLYLTFCPNLSGYLYGVVLFLGQIWSLGVEEFFYLFFPIGLHFVSTKNNLRYFLVLIIASITLTAVSKFWCSAGDPNLSLGCIYISRYRIYAFALGALAAYSYIKMQNNSLILKNKKVLASTGYVLLLLSAVMLIGGVTFSSLTHPVYAFIFAFLIFSITISNTKIAFLNNRVIVYFGKISYGIYMLHSLAIFICMRLFYFDTGNNFLDVVIFDAMSIVIVIFFAIISYTFLEKPFLRMR